MMKNIGWCLPLVAVLTLVGCSTGDRLYPVTGTVKYADGSAPQGEVATIRFEPIKKSEDAMGRSPAAGQLDAEGKFQLTTREANDGVQAGDYKVTLTILKKYGGQESLVASKYELATTTPLNAKVGPDLPKHFDFVVERR